MRDFAVSGPSLSPVKGPVLGIETSCDETGVAIYDSRAGCLLADALYSQVALHARYGGVVPELASRDHVRKLLPLIEQVLEAAQLVPTQLAGIAYTEGPGLLGALLVGASLARSLAYVWQIPAIGIHHMEGHLLAPLLEDNPPEFPFVALLVSGGHTMLIDVQGIGEYSLLGESLDDAVGEAFDKTAKLLGLGYPGGPAVASCAARGNPARFGGKARFPRPMTDRPGLDFSFSGLKTFTLTCWQQTAQTDQDRADVAWAFQDAAVDTLLVKCRRALKASGHKRLVVAGGVSANTELRKRLDAMAAATGVQVYYPRLAFCTDNGAMIAYAGSLRLASGMPPAPAPLAITARARWPLAELDSPAGKAG